MRSAPSPRRERGVVLVLTLWVVALLAVLGAAAARDARERLALARVHATRVQLDAAAEGVLWRVVDDVVDLPAAPLVPPDGVIVDVPASGRSVLVRVTDESAKTDLNGASPELLAATLRATAPRGRRDPLTVDALLDWRDADDTARPEGAEQDDYRRAGRATGPKNAPFEAVRELRQVPGVDGARFRRLRPLVTVVAPGGATGPTTAGDASDDAPAAYAAGHAYMIEVEAAAAGVTAGVRAVIAASSDAAGYRVLAWESGAPGLRAGMDARGEPP